jgi:galactose mutarotase-like enzyme
LASTRFVREDRYWGAEVAVLENEHLRVKVVPEKGADIAEVYYKKRGLNLLYQSPIGFRKFGAVSVPIGTGDSSFLDFYEGGWQDILPNPGLVSSNKGASWGMHGESSLLPWRASIADEGETARLNVSTELMRYPFRVDKTVSLAEGSPTLRVDETVTNLAEQDMEFAWVQHIVFTRPMVGPGMSVDMRAGSCTAGAYKQTRLKPDTPFEWPNAPAKDGSTIDMSGAPPTGKRYEDNLFINMKEPWYAIRNSQASLTVGVSWDLKVLPSMWYWLNNGALDYPWWGRSYNLGLEPASSLTELGMKEYLEKGNALKLDAGGSMKLGIRYSVAEGSAAVRMVDGEGRLLR